MMEINPGMVPPTANPNRFPPWVGDPVSSLWHRLRRGTSLIRKQSDWDRFAGEDWAGRIMTLPVTDRLHEKQGRSIGRLKLKDGREILNIYLKRHFKLPWWNGILATLFPGQAWSPGLQEWQKLCWANSIGLPVPRPVSAGQFVGPWGHLTGFLAVEELEGMLPLHEAIPLAATKLGKSAFAKWKRGLAAEIARLTIELHGRKVFHKDLYFCHFYISEESILRPPVDWNRRVYVIDLHRLNCHALTAFWWKIKDLAQLLYSSDVTGVTARDRLRFWKLYRNDARTPSQGWLARFVSWKWRLYVRHNRRRPSEVPAIRSAA